MSNYSGKALDGYLLSDTDGYTFVTPWIDMQNAQHFSYTAIITSGGTIDGTFTLQQSNEQQSGNSSGTFPMSAGDPLGDADDTVNVPPISGGIGTGGVTLAMDTSGEAVTLCQQHIGYRWSRLIYLTTTENLNGTVSVWYHWKF